MGGFQHQMPRRINQWHFALRITPPEDKRHMRSAVADHLDHRVGELLPSSPLVRARLMLTNCECGIEQKHSLVGPSCEVAREGYVSADVVLDFLVDIHERRGDAHTVGHRECQSLCLSRLMVRVLPQYHHLHAIERTAVESIENQLSRRIDPELLILAPHEVSEMAEIRLVEFRL